MRVQGSRGRTDSHASEISVHEGPLSLYIVHLKPKHGLSLNIGKTLPKPSPKVQTTNPKPQTRNRKLNKPHTRHLAHLSAASCKGPGNCAARPWLESLGLEGDTLAGFSQRILQFRYSGILRVMWAKMKAIRLRVMRVCRPRYSVATYFLPFIRPSQKNHVLAQSAGK